MKRVMNLQIIGGMPQIPKEDRNTSSQGEVGYRVSVG